jgi:hypothetical protein
MSGLDGLGWPNPKDEPKPTKSMSDTPETDAEVNELKSATTYNMVWAEFARKLERERDEAREETIRTREFMGRGFAKAKEELATMETRHAATMMHTQSVVEDANQLREQRDKLTEAVNAATVLIAAKGRHNTMLAYEGLRSALSPNADVEARRK